jgi:hypothetical protein
MPTVCPRLRFEEHPKVSVRMEACAHIWRQAVDYALANRKAATLTIIKALCSSLRDRHPDLHPVGVLSAVRARAAVVPSFRNRLRKGGWGWQAPDRGPSGLPSPSGSHPSYPSPSPQASLAAG